MSNLTIPEGLTVAKVISEDLDSYPNKENFRNYLDFTDRKITQICSEVIHKILKAISEGKPVNLIVPLNGGLLFYRKLMEFSKYSIDFSNYINIIFCDESFSGELCLSATPLDVTNAYNIAIDDIWDRGGTGKNIVEALRQYGPMDTLDYFAFCKKEDSPIENGGAVIGNPDSITVFPEEWLHAWGGMNSGKFEEGDEAAIITALERTSFLPLIPTDTLPKFDINNPDCVEQYKDLLTQTNLAVNGVIPLQVYYDILFLEQNPDLNTRFKYLINIHSQYLGEEVIRIGQTLKVES